MTLNEIKKQLDLSFENGYYISLPHYRSNECLYIEKGGKLFHLMESRVVPTNVFGVETTTTDWFILK